MNEVIRFALLGLGVGALYAFASQGLIVIYRGTGVLNFSLGATAIAGVYLEWELQYEHGMSFLLASAFGVALSALLGVLTHWVIMRPLRQASSLVRVIATLGVLVTIQAGVVIRYGSNPRKIDSWLPDSRVSLWGDVGITVDRFILFGIASASAFGLWLLYRSSQFGLATEAVSESERSAAAVGISPNRIAVLNWALGSAIAALAGILVVPIITLQVTAMTSLILAALAAALIGDFRSFPVATAAGLLLGVGQTLVGWKFPDQQGLGPSLPFLVIIVFLVFKGRSLPLRDYFLKQMPMLGNGRLSWDWMLLGFGFVVFLMLTKQAKWVDALTVTMGVGIVLLSIVVLTGYAGQLSLGQYAIAGFGAYVAGRLVSVFHLPFLVGLVAGVAAAVPLGIVFGLPAVRTRGINLAIVTLGLGTTMELMLFRNRNYTGGVQGTQVGNPDIFGFDIGSIKHPARYGVFVVVMAMLAVVVVSNVRRGRSGRRLIAVRTNERAAASLGIDVMVAKLFAFALAAAIAALGGILLAFRLSSISYQSFDNFTSVTYVGLTLVGGVGHLLGAFVGGTMATAALNQEIMESTWDGVGRWIQLISGIAILLTVLGYQDGVAAEWVKIFRLFKKARKWGRSYIIELADVSAPVAPGEHTKVPARTLSLAGLTVRYGAVVAVNDVSCRLEPGTVTGLIGPNGAGKTSLIDAISGFATAEGRVVLDDVDLSDLSAVKRARSGVVRSFQSLELFEDSTVFENLSVAADPQDFRSYLRDLVWPVNPPFPTEVVRAIVEFQLDQDLHRDVKDLSYGKRRLLAIARAVAMHPSVLLLDEPAAGLSSAESVELALVVRRLAEEWGMAILVVEHDMNFVMGVCDQILVLDFGRLIASGTPQQVRSDPAVIAAYLGEEVDEVEEVDSPSVATVVTADTVAAVGGGA